MKRVTVGFQYGFGFAAAAVFVQALSQVIKLITFLMFTVK